MLFQVYINILRFQGDPTSMESYISTISPAQQANIMDDMNSIKDPTSLSYILDKLTYQDYLNSLAISSDDADSIDDFIHGCCLSLGLDYHMLSVEYALGLIKSIKDQIKDLQSKFPEHSVPQVDHCQAFTAFSQNYQLQSSIQSLAEAWSCDWKHVLESPVDLCLQCLDFLSAKSSADYLDFKFRSNKK